MAYVNPSGDTDDELNNPQNQQGQPQNDPGQLPAPQTSFGVGGDSSKASGGGAGGGVTPTRGGSPPVQDLGAYLRANAPQAAQMGHTIAGNIGKAAQDVQTNLASAGQQFGEQVKASGAPENSSQIIQQAAQNPIEFAKDPNNVTAFQNVKNAKYTGPQNFESTPFYSDLNKQIQNAVSSAPDVSNPANIMQLVRGQERNPTLGESHLDSMLLQQSPEGIKAIQDARAPYANLGDSLRNLASSGNTQITDATRAAQEAAGLVPSAFQSGENAVVPAWQKALQGKLTSAQGNVSAYNEGLNKLLGIENAATPKVAALQAAINAWNEGRVPGFGPSPEIAGINLMDFGNPNSVGAPSLDAVASQDDVAMQNALEQLLGDGFSDYFDESQAGQFTSPGSVPSLQSLLNPKLEDLDNKFSKINTDIWNFANRNNPSKKALPGNIRKAENDLREYLASIGA